jgi:hypothetical protein
VLEAESLSDSALNAILEFAQKEKERRKLQSASLLKRSNVPPPLPLSSSSLLNNSMSSTITYKVR